jgi:hypothetical protein
LYLLPYQCAIDAQVSHTFTKGGQKLVKSQAEKQWTKHIALLDSVEDET